MKLPQKPGKALNTFLRKTIFNGHKHIGNCAKQERLFPQGFGVADWPMIETIEEDGTVRIDYQGDPIYGKQQIADYVAQFCKLNCLKGA